MIYYCVEVNYLASTCDIINIDDNLKPYIHNKWHSFFSEDRIRYVLVSPNSLYGFWLLYHGYFKKKIRYPVKNINQFIKIKKIMFCTIYDCITNDVHIYDDIDVCPYFKDDI